MPEKRSDQKVLDFKDCLDRVNPNAGTDYEETIYDENDEAWGRIVLIQTFFVHEKTGKVSLIDPT